MNRFYGLFMCCVMAITSSSVFAGEADVLDVKISRVDADVYRFSVTVKHDDEGWDHYADQWEVFDLEGNSLGTRVLMHPHVNEQPFTRSMTLSIPMHVKEVVIRAHDKVHGSGGVEFNISLPR